LRCSWYGTAWPISSDRSFVENASDLLIAAGHGRENIRTERLGATGELK
jgi:hypothetical protein